MTMETYSVNAPAGAATAWPEDEVEWQADDNRLYSYSPPDVTPVQGDDDTERSDAA